MRSLHIYIKFPQIRITFAQLYVKSLQVCIELTQDTGHYP